MVIEAEEEEDLNFGEEENLVMVADLGLVTNQAANCVENMVTLPRIVITGSILTSKSQMLILNLHLLVLKPMLQYLHLNPLMCLKL